MDKNYWQQGFSLVQGMMLAAAVAGTALVTTKVVTQQKESDREVRQASAIDQVHAMMSSIFTSTRHCYTTVAATSGGINLTPNEVRNVTSVILNGGGTAFNIHPTNANAVYMNQQVRVASASLAFPADLADPARLTIMYQKIGGKGVIGATGSTRFIDLSVQRSPTTGSLVGCSSISEDNSVTGLNDEELFEQFCNELGLTIWDDSLKNCTIKSNVCPSHQLLSGFDASGNVICRSINDYLPYISVNPPANCPGDFDSIRLAQETVFPFRVTTECNKTNETCQSDMQFGWNQVNSFGANSTCQAPVPRKMRDEYQTINDPWSSGVTLLDVTGRRNGTATVKCNADTGLFELDPMTPPTCRADCAAEAAGARAWTGTVVPTGRTCRNDTAIPVLENGQTLVLNDTTTGPSLRRTGSATVTCVNGTLTFTGPRTCTIDCITPPPTPMTRTWTGINADICNSTNELPRDYPDNAIFNLVDTNSPLTTTGSANYRCNAGTWVVSGTPTCTSPGSGGTCTWTQEITYEFTGCLGFMTGTSPPGAGNGNFASSAAACYANTAGRCGTVASGHCIGNRKFVGCLYTPN